MEALGRLGTDTLRGTRRRIIGIAGALFSERSYLGVSMSDIAERLDITKPALYYHFSSKRKLYAEVLDEAFTELRNLVTEAKSADSPDRQLHQLVKNYLDFGMRERNLVNALVMKLHPEDADLKAQLLSFRQELADQAKPVVWQAVSGRGPAKKTDGARLTEMLMALMDGLLIEYSFLDKPLNAERVADEILAFLRLREGSPTGDDGSAST